MAWVGAHALPTLRTELGSVAHSFNIRVDDLLLLASTGPAAPAAAAVTDVDLVGLVTDAVAVGPASAPEAREIHVRDPALGLSLPGAPMRGSQVVDNLVSGSLRQAPDELPFEVCTEGLPSA